MLPSEWWEAVEVHAAVVSLGGTDGYDGMLKAYRKSRIGRGHALRAKDFDNAVSGADKAMAGKHETVDDLLRRSAWYAKQGITPVIVRPVGWEWTDRELEVIRIAREGMEPKFLAFDTSGIDEIAGPATKPNPWDKWR